MLPSYIYYGVSDKESVIISKEGVPRFATKEVLIILKKKHLEIEIYVENLERIHELIKEINKYEYKESGFRNEIIKDIVDKRVNNN